MIRIARDPYSLSMAVLTGMQFFLISSRGLPFLRDIAAIPSVLLTAYFLRSWLIERYELTHDTLTVRDITGKTTTVPRQDVHFVMIGYGRLGFLLLSDVRGKMLGAVSGMMKGFTCFRDALSLPHSLPQQSSIPNQDPAG